MEDVTIDEMIENPKSVREVQFQRLKDVRESKNAEQEMKTDNADQSLSSTQAGETDTQSPGLKRSTARGAASRQLTEKEAKRTTEIEAENRLLRDDLKILRGDLDQLSQLSKDKERASVATMSEQRRQISGLIEREREVTDQLRRLSITFNERQDALDNERDAWQAREKILNRSASKSRAEIDGLRGRLQSAQSECERLNKVEQDRGWQIQELEKKFKGQAATISMQENMIETSVTKYQMAAISMLSQSVSTSLPDDQVRKTFEEMFDDLTTWARDNATPDALQKDSPELQALKGKLWQCFEVEESGPDLNFDFSDPTATDSLLNAALAKNICRKFLRGPFFFANHTHPIMSETAEGEWLGTDRALEKITRTLKKSMPRYPSICNVSTNKRLDEHDVAAAHAWRAMTVQTLCQAVGARERIEQLYRAVAEAFLADFTFLVRSELPEEEKESLINTFRAFGDFSIRLWSQKYHVEYSGLWRLRDRRFMLAAPDMIAADAVKLDENDKSLDGRPIAVVLQPLIEGYGTPDGKEYNKRRIWSKAKVWVSSGSTEGCARGKQRG